MANDLTPVVGVGINNNQNTARTNNTPSRHGIADSLQNSISLLQPDAGSVERQTKQQQNSGNNTPGSQTQTPANLSTSGVTAVSPILLAQTPPVQTPPNNPLFTPNPNYYVILEPQGLIDDEGTGQIVGDKQRSDFGGELTYVLFDGIALSENNPDSIVTIFGQTANNDSRYPSLFAAPTKTTGTNFAVIRNNLFDGQEINVDKETVIDGQNLFIKNLPNWGVNVAQDILNGRASQLQFEPSAQTEGVFNNGVLPGFVHLNYWGSVMSYNAALQTWAENGVTEKPFTVFSPHSLAGRKLEGKLREAITNGEVTNLQGLQQLTAELLADEKVNYPLRFTYEAMAMSQDSPFVDAFIANSDPEGSDLASNPIYTQLQSQLGLRGVAPLTEPGVTPDFGTNLTETPVVTATLGMNADIFNDKMTPTIAENLPAASKVYDRAIERDISADRQNLPPLFWAGRLNHEKNPVTLAKAFAQSPELQGVYNLNVHIQNNTHVNPVLAWEQTREGGDVLNNIFGIIETNSAEISADTKQGLQGDFAEWQAAKTEGRAPSYDTREVMDQVLVDNAGKLNGWTSAKAEHARTNSGEVLAPRNAQERVMEQLGEWQRLKAENFTVSEEVLQQLHEVLNVPELEGKWTSYGTKAQKQMAALEHRFGQAPNPQDRGHFVLPTIQEPTGTVGFEASRTGMLYSSASTNGSASIFERAGMDTFNPLDPADMAKSILANHSNAAELQPALLEVGKDHEWNKVAARITSVRDSYMKQSDGEFPALDRENLNRFTIFAGDSRLPAFAKTIFDTVLRPDGPTVSLLRDTNPDGVQGGRNPMIDVTGMSPQEVTVVNGIVGPNGMQNGEEVPNATTSSRRAPNLTADNGLPTRAADRLLQIERSDWGQYTQANPNIMGELTAANDAASRLPSYNPGAMVLGQRLLINGAQPEAVLNMVREGGHPASIWNEPSSMPQYVTDHVNFEEFSTQSGAPSATAQPPVEQMFLDYDGTISIREGDQTRAGFPQNDNAQSINAINQLTVEALGIAQEGGVAVTVVTGNNIENVIPRIAETGLNVDALATRGGTQIWRRDENGDFLRDAGHDETMRTDFDNNRVANILQEVGVSQGAYVERQAEFRNGAGKETVHVAFPGEMSNGQYQQRIERFDAEVQRRLSDTSLNTQTGYNAIAEQPEVEHFNNLGFSRVANYDVFHASAGKASAADALAGSGDINTVISGDALNDISLYDIPGVTAIKPANAQQDLTSAVQGRGNVVSSSLPGGLALVEHLISAGHVTYADLEQRGLTQNIPQEYLTRLQAITPDSSSATPQSPSTNPGLGQTGITPPEGGDQGTQSALRPGGDTSGTSFGTTPFGTLNPGSLNPNGIIGDNGSQAGQAGNGGRGNAPTAVAAPGGDNPFSNSIPDQVPLDWAGSLNNLSIPSSVPSWMNLPIDPDRPDVPASSSSEPAAGPSISYTPESDSGGVTIGGQLGSKGEAEKANTEMEQLLGKGWRQGLRPDLPPTIIDSRIPGFGEGVPPADVGSNDTSWGLPDEPITLPENEGFPEKDPVLENILNPNGVGRPQFTFPPISEGSRIPEVPAEAQAAFTKALPELQGISYAQFSQLSTADQQQVVQRTLDYQQLAPNDKTNISLIEYLDSGKTSEPQRQQLSQFNAAQTVQQAQLNTLEARTGLDSSTLGLINARINALQANTAQINQQTQSIQQSNAARLSTLATQAQADPVGVAFIQPETPQSTPENRPEINAPVSQDSAPIPRFMVVRTENGPKLIENLANGQSQLHAYPLSADTPITRQEPNGAWSGVPDVGQIGSKLFLDLLFTNGALKMLNNGNPVQAPNSGTPQQPPVNGTPQTPMGAPQPGF